MKNFAITGVAGYIAPRHLQAIKDTNNNLVAAVDPHDSVGILDKYFPDASFFTEFERFDRHLEKLRRTGEINRAHYLSICSPNHLHDAHIRLALRIGAHAICEKPLVLNPWNLDVLQELEQESESRIYNVLQLRLHSDLKELKKKISTTHNNTKYNVSLTYITSRGLWYNYSWKGIIEKSGGIGTNIGVHFFDLLIWLFGSVVQNEVHIRERDRMSGYLELEKANISWFLSTNKNDLPQSISNEKKYMLRTIKINNEEISLSEGFTDLHSKVYAEILKGNGFGIDDARPSIKLVHEIRSCPIKKNKETEHHILTKTISG
jgi:UDP-N-acetyl-2-amino-2-deoxyglucuronate dehydrogenase